MLSIFLCAKMIKFFLNVSRFCNFRQMKLTVVEQLDKPPELGSLSVFAQLIFTRMCRCENWVKGVEGKLAGCTDGKRQLAVAKQWGGPDVCVLANEAGVASTEPAGKIE